MTTGASNPARDRYSAHFIRFVQAHLEEFETVYLGMTSTRVLQERLAAEFRTLPPRHSCSCRCPQEQRGYPACRECLRLKAERVKQDVPAEYGRSTVPSSRVPLPLLLDLERALSVLRTDNPASIARFLNGPEAA